MGAGGPGPVASGEGCDEAESWITPPPAPLLRKRAGRSSSSASQSRTSVSTSVQAGPVCHSIPWVPKVVMRASARIAGAEELDWK
ncbi:hypothetical protein BH24ACT4_BH24ACT4_13270 [soil metagenome]